MTVGNWDVLLARAIAANGVPGASLALRRDGRDTVATAGVADLTTGAPVTPATTFRLGSTTKILTAMLLMRQVETGRVDLDSPVLRLLPDFVLDDPVATATVTPRQCVSHCGGFFGDILNGPSEDDDALAAYVAAGRRLKQITPAGTAFSYCNAGFAIAGRLSEVAAGQRWDDAIRDTLLGPMRMTRSGTRPGARPDADASAPHVAGTDGLPIRLEVEPIGRCMAPAGSLAWTTPSDLLRLGRTLAGGGMAPGGVRILAPGSVEAMRALEVDGPTPTFATGWGLGIQRFNSEGTTFGHDGAVAGQYSFLRICADRDLVLALTCNGGDARGLFNDIKDVVEAEIGAPLGDATPAWPAPAGPSDRWRYTGTYAVPRYTVEVSASAGGLHACFVPSPEAGDFDAPIHVELRPQPHDITGELFLARLPGNRLPTQQRFGRLPDGRRSLLFRGRLLPEIAS